LKYKQLAPLALSTLLVGVFLLPNLATAAESAVVSSPYLYNFNQNGRLPEAWPLEASNSPYWWVNSGAYLVLDGGRGHTVQGELPGLDTDNGYHPQNIFRLTTRSKWQDARQEAYFIINKTNLSESPNRNESNGLLLFSRYHDGDNLYYAGLRVDGAAVIKKKQGGRYHTLASSPGVYAGTYNRQNNPNLLREQRWIGLRSEVKNLPNGSVSIKLYIDKLWSGNWELVAEAIDDGSQGAPLRETGYAGIRTDFMDVTIENYRLRNI
jgi:hypothetical protein